MCQTMLNKLRLPLIWVILLAFLFCGCSLLFSPGGNGAELETIPDNAEEAYAVLADNQPDFTPEQLVKESYEFYSELDALNRCGYAMACIGRDIMPTEERGSIGQVKPTGWQTVKYDSVDGKYLYNRCHLIGYQLTGENANERNLITGTRYMNVEGMLPFENMVADYIKETGNHVVYRVTPVFRDGELVARGVQMEGWSVEDAGEGICFNVYVFNKQPGIEINYTDGTSQLQETSVDETKVPAETYILNTNSKKFHRQDCGQAASIAESNKKIAATDRRRLLDQGYEPAGCCKP